MPDQDRSKTTGGFNRREFLGALGGAALAASAPRRAHAQPPPQPAILLP